MKTTRSLLVALFVALAFSSLASAAIIPINFASGGLNGANEVPANASTGTGGEIGAGITFNDVTKVLTVNVGWGAANGFTNLSASVTAAHIHLAAPGVNGPVIIPLTVVGSTINVTTPPLSATNEAALFAGNLYVNVHTATYPGGEIRGQLIPAIAWMTSTISGPADVSTAGVLVGAMNVGVQHGGDDQWRHLCRGLRCGRHAARARLGDGDSSALEFRTMTSSSRQTSAAAWNTRRRSMTRALTIRQLRRAAR